MPTTGCQSAPIIDHAAVTASSLHASRRCAGCRSCLSSCVSSVPSCCRVSTAPSSCVSTALSSRSRSRSMPESMSPGSSPGPDANPDIADLDRDRDLRGPNAQCCLRNSTASYNYQLTTDASINGGGCRSACQSIRHSDRAAVSVTPFSRYFPRNFRLSRIPQKSH